MNLSSKIRLILRENSLSHKENGKSFILDCPKCNHHEKLYIHKVYGNFICFSCSSGETYQGRIEIILSDLLEITPDRALKLLDVSDFSGPLFEVDEVQTAAYKNFPPSVVGPDHRLFQKAATYLNSRGITQELIDFYDIRYDYSTKRVIFQVRDKGGLIGWTDRIIHDKLEYINQFGELKRIPKSLHNFNKSQYLLFDHLWPKNAEHLIVAEGPISALKAHRCENTVATMGKLVSNKQIALIRSRRVKKLFLALDPDAYQEIEKMVRKLYGTGCDIYLLLPTKGRKDLGECSLDEVYDLFKSCNEKLTPSHIILA